jgi:circadian clock protein KaiB
MTAGAVIYVLRLYIAGASPRSARAAASIRRLCEDHLAGRHDLQVFDICQHPELAQGAQVLAAPTLVKQSPLPLRRFVGDMSSIEGVLRGLDLDEPAMRTAASASH